MLNSNRSIYKIPVRVTQMPQFLKGLAWRGYHAAVVPHRQSLFRLCYFTCSSYFPYLYCSIHSLAQLKLRHRLEVWVFCDREEILSDRQILILKETGIAVRVVPWEKAQGWGGEQIQAIWRAYRLAAEGTSPDTLIARVDSDVFFFSSWIFDLVSRANADVVGDGHFVDFKYCQGGVYFFRSRAVNRVLGMVPIEGVPAELSRVGINVEDIAAYHFAKASGLKVKLVFFMMFPDEYGHAGALTSFQMRKFSCLHFTRKDKRPMVDIYLKEMVVSGDRVEVLTALFSK